MAKQKKSFIRVVPATTCKLVSCHRTPKYLYPYLEREPSIMISKQNYFIGERNNYRFLQVTATITQDMIYVESEELKTGHYNAYRKEYNKLYYELLKSIRYHYKNSLVLRATCYIDVFGKLEGCNED